MNLTADFVHEFQGYIVPRKVKTGCDWWDTCQITLNVRKYHHIRPISKGPWDDLKIVSQRQIWIY